MASPSPVQATLNCKLPVASGDGPVDGNPSHGATGHGGFVQFPTGAFTPDPSSMGTYDRARSKWLPVFRTAVSPDGSHYAYSVNPVGPGPLTGTIHVVDGNSGADRSIVVPSPSNVIDYAAEGIYVDRVVASSGAPPSGLALIDPVGGTYRQITATGTWTAVGGGFAWGADFDSSIPGPAGGEPNPANRLRKLDLKTGAATTVAQYPGMGVTILGVDSGLPVVSAMNGSDYSVSRLDGTKMFLGPVSNANPASPIVSDGGAIWFSSSGGDVWRWDDPAAGIHRVASTPLQGAFVAASCR